MAPIKRGEVMKKIYLYYKVISFLRCINNNNKICSKYGTLMKNM